MKNYILLIVCTLILYNAGTAKIKPTQLTCEYLENPTIVDVKHPRLSWINIAEENERNQTQTAWQVRVASTKDLLEKADLWDSKKVESNQSIRIEYNGKTLKSRQDCWWQVRVWDKNGEVSEWSEPAYWHMGLLNESDWKATWIGAPWQGEEALPKPTDSRAPKPEKYPPPAPMFRKEFNVEKKVKKAVAYVTGLGYFEMYLNGKKVGDDVLVPNQTNYGKRPTLMEQYIPVPDNFREYKVMYLAYDLTDQLTSGKNCVGAMVGNGFYNPAKYWAEAYGTPRFLAQIYVTYTDGSEDIIVSDQTWKASKSPILMDLVYYGEHYDARLEQPGWNQAGFDDSAWETVTIRKAPEGKLVAHTAHPDKVVERLKPVAMERMFNGNWLIDFGQEVAGWVRLDNISGPEGHKIEIIYLSNTFSGDNTYTLSGKENESYAARFNWFIFRQIEIVNLPGRNFNPDQVTAEVVHTYVDESAQFETSNTRFNQINKIWKRSQTDNMHGGIASDCPHRERAPYTGDGQVSCVTVMHNFDAKSFYHKWIHDIIGAQNIESGYVPNGAPWEPGCGGGVAWGAAINIMPWEFYTQFGSKDIIEDSYVPMKEYVRYMQTWVDEDGIMYSQRTGNDGNVLRWFNLGEWAVPGQMPPDDLVHTFYFWRCTDFTAKTAKALGNEKEAKIYADLAEKTRKAFMKRFYNDETGSYGSNGGNIFALRMGVPQDQYEKVIAALKKDIKENDGHLDTGIFGTQFFFEVLSENGLHDLAYEAMNKNTMPSYGYWLELGATTSRESWGRGGGGSHNHPMFGGGLAWFYRKLAGMNADSEEPGYRHIIFKPQPVDDISYTKYYNNTSYGNAGIFWQQENDSFSMDVTVPVGCHATVYVPAAKGKKVLESSKEIAGSASVKFMGEEDGYKILSVNSGKYNFLVD